MNRDKLAAQLVVDEAKRKRVYIDSVGKITGGVGRNLTDRDFSEDEINLMLNNDINMVQHDLDTNCSWWRSMTDARQNALANMCFNLGISRLLGFKHMIDFAKNGDYDQAAKEMLDSTWAKQVGPRSIRISELMKTGEFP